MANANSTARAESGATTSTPECIVLPIEPTIIADPVGAIAVFRGTRSMLEAEGLAPPDGEWPAGFATVYWQSDGFNYSLCRFKPDGAKGPRRIFAALDWFNLNWERSDKTSFEQRAIERKQHELAEAIYRYSSKGRAERDAQWFRYWESREDKRFQSFKEACGIVERKPGRRTKSESRQGVSLNLNTGRDSIEREGGAA